MTSAENTTGPAPPSGLWRTLARGGDHSPLPKGLDAIWDRAAGASAHAMPRRRWLLKRAERVLGLEPELASLGSDALRAEIEKARAAFRRRRETRRNVERALALIREVAWRELGLRPFREQVAAALAMHAGCITEVATGEGKTLAATMPAILAGWRGHGCHVITANDYLAKRDAEWMAPVYRWCGLTAAHVDGEMDPASRAGAYAADITYATNKEVAADFLRDRLTLGRKRGLTETLVNRITGSRRGGTDRLVMRGLEHAIVDEADSLLVDEAVTPLIISADAGEAGQTEVFETAAHMAGELARDRDYRVDTQHREIELTEAGRSRLAELTEGLGGIWTGERRSEELVVQALTADELFHPGKHYVVHEGRVAIVDEFTGRLMPDRTWRNGLHQAVEAKEGLEIQPPKDTRARVSFQRFFRLYRSLAGMTGTAWEARRELWQIYQTPVVRVPTHLPCRRVERAPRLFGAASAKWSAVLEEIRSAHERGRPVLIGTRTVEASEHLSGLLEGAGLEHEILNAIRHEEEARIIADAGQKGKIMVATNMAGRGTDIKLGPGVAEIGGLHVVATEAHEAGRIDRQLYGRAGRQGDPGTAVTFASLEDELFRRHGPGWAARIAERDPDRELPSGLARRLIRRAQARAKRLALRQRKGVLKTDDWLDEFLGFAGKDV